MRPLSVGKALVANTKTTIFTVPTRQIAKWNLFFASNHSTSSKWITCWWYDKSENTEIEIVFQYGLTSKAFLKLDNSYTVLEEGDEIRVQSETGSACTVICTFELEGNSAVQYSQY